MNLFLSFIFLFFSLLTIIPDGVIAGDSLEKMKRWKARDIFMMNGKKIE